MTVALHPWWATLGEGVATPDNLTSEAARTLAHHVASGANPAVALVELKESRDVGFAAVRFDVEVERPQDLAHPIRAVEPIAVAFALGPDTDGPCVLALRDDFPDTPHQNWVPEGVPCSLCVDDRPWIEARLGSTPADLIRRIQLWLSKAARGELHDHARPLEPLFFHAPRTLVLPRAALSVAPPGNAAGALAPESAELVGFVRREDDPRVVLARPLSELGGKIPKAGRLTILTFRVASQPMARLRRAPCTLAGLASEMGRCGLDLIKELRSRLTAWAGLEAGDLQRLSSALAIVVAFPVASVGGEEDAADDLRAFVTGVTAGEIGVALGCLYRNTSEVGAKEGYVPALMLGSHASPLVPSAEAEAGAVPIEPMEVHLFFDRELAATIAGKQEGPDRRKAVLVGAGSVGSQVALGLVREGTFSWTVVDHDRLMPHNLARHALTAPDVGLPKAAALAGTIAELLGEPANAVVADLLDPDVGRREELRGILDEADLIIDASASVAVARYLADLPGAARRASVFFNPMGTAVVLLVESDDRGITLRDLEAQYHRLILSDPCLAGHLDLTGGSSGVRYTGSCRALTNRIPATRAALLSALAARGLTGAIADASASVTVWALAAEGDVRRVHRNGAAVRSMDLNGWRISCDEGLLSRLAALRLNNLPNETGGVLLGIADVSRRSIHVAHALPQPSDSAGTAQGFERGVVGLRGDVTRMVEASMHQLRYVGEWHSHPRRASPLPSSTDLAQVGWLARELIAEGLPALMAIASDAGTFTFVVRDEASLSDD